MYTMHMYQYDAKSCNGTSTGSFSFRGGCFKDSTMTTVNCGPDFVPCITNDIFDANSRVSTLRGARSFRYYGNSISIYPTTDCSGDTSSDYWASCEPDMTECCKMDYFSDDESVVIYQIEEGPEIDPGSCGGGCIGRRSGGI